jgi:hypothetical protein
MTSGRVDPILSRALAIVLIPVVYRLSRAVVILFN